jgi:hypothetical protein
MGIAWMRDCAATPGTCYVVDDPSAMLAYHAYYAVDSLARLVIVAFSIAALLWSSKNHQRLALVAASCIALGAGTAIDFILRERSLGDAAVAILQTFDALCTLAFVIGLFIALTKKQIFDVTMYLSKGLVYAGVFALLALLSIALSAVLPYQAILAAVLAAIVATLAKTIRSRISVRFIVYAASMIALFGLCCFFEGSLHFIGGAPFEELAKHLPFIGWIDGAPAYASDLALAGIGSLLLKTWEERAAEQIQTRLMPENEKRIERLKLLRKSLGLYTKAADLERILVDTVVSAIEADFAHLFWRGHDERFEAAATCPPSMPAPPPVTEDELPRPLTGCDHCEPGDCECVSGAKLFSRMSLRGKIAGFFAAGPKQCENGECYSDPEKRALDALAKEAAIALDELQHSKEQRS